MKAAPKGVEPLDKWEPRMKIAETSEIKTLLHRPDNKKSNGKYWEY